MPSLTYKTRRRLSLLFLLVGLPLYIVVAVNVLALFDRPGIVTELLVYAGLGVLWSFPMRFVFSGVGRPDPDAPKDDTR